MKPNQDVNGGLDLFGQPTLARAAHELKSPLVLIRQLALELQDGSIDSPGAARLINQIGLTSERALNLATNLTKIARLDEDDGLFRLEPVNPLQVCEDVAVELAPLYRANDRELRVKRVYHAPLAVANRELLHQVLVNFADNALQYSHAALPVEISVEARAKSQVRIGIRDYGPATDRQVYDRFQHARPRSSGLGLMIARQFAEAMNGRTGVTRHRDGATFYIDMYASRQMSLL